MKLNFRCSFLRQHGWHVLSAGTGHAGILSFREERVTVVIVDLDRDGSEGALIAGELKRLRPEIPILMIVTPGQPFITGALQSANAVVSRLDELPNLIEALDHLTEAA